jgi:hypothetical protein
MRAMRMNPGAHRDVFDLRDAQEPRHAWRCACASKGLSAHRADLGALDAHDARPVKSCDIERASTAMIWTNCQI